MVCVTCFYACFVHTAAASPHIIIAGAELADERNVRSDVWLTALDFLRNQPCARRMQESTARVQRVVSRHDAGRYARILGSTIGGSADKCSMAGVSRVRYMFSDNMHTPKMECVYAIAAADKLHHVSIVKEVRLEQLTDTNTPYTAVIECHMPHNMCPTFASVAVVQRITVAVIARRTARGRTGESSVVNNVFLPPGTRLERVVTETGKTLAEILQRQPPPWADDDGVSALAMIEARATIEFRLCWEIHGSAKTTFVI